MKFRGHALVRQRNAIGAFYPKRFIVEASNPQHAVERTLLAAAAFGYEPDHVQRVELITHVFRRPEDGDEPDFTYALGGTHARDATNDRGVQGLRP